MKIFIGADHRGFSLKEHLKPWLTERGHEVIDCGNHHQDQNDDYVDFGLAVARKIAEDHHHSHEPDSAIGIGICGSGVGISIIANRIKGVRAALSFHPDHATHARENDHANMLSLASEWVTFNEAQDIIIAFLKAQPKRVEKYRRRVQKLDRV